MCLFSQTRVLRTVLGYLAADGERRPLLIQVSRCSAAPRCHIERRCVSAVGVQLWNNVEMDVRMVNSFLVFKGINYKKFLRVINVIEMYLYGRCMWKYVCMYVCIYVYTYIYICMYVYIVILFFILYTFSDLFDINLG